MMKFIIKNKIKGGYAMLFAVIIVSAISVITAGLINATYKQIILSSLAKNSQLAFYQADTAADCALYAEQVLRDERPEFFKEDGGGDWSCGGYNLIIKPSSDIDYKIYSQELEDSTEPCFRISVSGTTGKQKIKASGYNVCNLYNKRTVERSIEINFSEK